MIKKHAPLEQLKRDAAKANDLLIKKGIIAKDSIVDRITADPTKPKLPGMPPYLPRPWTLGCSQVLMRNIVKYWVTHCKENKKTNPESIKEFFQFVEKHMYQQYDSAKKKEKKMGKMIRTLDESILLSEVFAPSNLKETTKSMHLFFVHSMVIAQIVKRNTSTSEYVDWFLNEWTPDLVKLWQ